MASEKVLTVNQGNFDQDVLKSEVPVLVDFWAEWCGPCKMLAPVVDKIAASYEGKLKVAKVNVDENNALAGQFGIMSIPTLLVFKGGQPVERLVGFMPERELTRKIEGVI